VKKGGDIMSIFQSVQKAEEKAEAIKKEAVEKVNLMLAETREKSEKDAKAIIDDATRREKEIDVETLAAIDNKEKEIFAACDREIEEQQQVAERNFEATLDYIVEKVFSL
jgi:uncharacterized 2Fe-2S/4Fe-4S cluster protein (DUF4445 family)